MSQQPQVPPVQAIQLGWPVNFEGEERYISGISRAPGDEWVTIDGSIDRFKLDEVDWIREIFRSEDGEPGKRVRLW